MKRICKKISIIFLFVTVGFTLLLSILNAMNFRPVMGLVSSSVSTLLGRSFSASGFSFGYNSKYGFSLYIHNVELENPKWAKKPQMFSLDSASISLSLLSLMSGTVKVTNIVAENISIDVIDKTGSKKNYIFSNTDESSAISNDNVQSSEVNKTDVPEDPTHSTIFIPQILLHNVKISYQNDDRNESIYIQELSLKDQNLGHNQLNADLVINDVGYILIGNTGNINNLFDLNGFDLKLKITSGVNSFDTKANIRMGSDLQINLDMLLNIQNMPSFFQTINASQVPNWAIGFKELNATSSLIYQNKSIDDLTLKANGNYKNKNIKLNVSAKSHNANSLYPLDAHIAVDDNMKKIFSLLAKVKEPYSKEEWLNVHVNASLPNLSYVIGNKIPLSNIALNANASIVGNEVKIKPFKFIAYVKDKPVTANLWLNANIKRNQPVKTKIIANVDYQQQMILGLNSSAIFPANGEWLTLRASGGITKLSELLQIFNITLPYKLTNFEYIIKATGDKPGHVNIAFDPININVNEQPVLSHVSSDINLKSLETIMGLKTIINGDTDSNITIKGLISPPDQKRKWANIKLSTSIKKASELNFLFPNEPNKLDNIGEIKTEVDFLANNGFIDLTIPSSVINLNNHELRYNADMRYGLYHAKQPLEVKLNAASGELDQFTILGQGNIKSGDEFHLNADGNINDLSYYSPILPTVVDIKTNTDLSIKDSIVHLKELNITGTSNEKDANLHLFAEIDLLQNKITKLNLDTGVADLESELDLSGVYQPLNINGNLALKAKNLSGVNQFIDDWGIGIVPILENLDLNMAYQLSKDSYAVDMKYFASGTDLKAKTDISTSKDDSHYKVDIQSKNLDVRAIKLAIEHAQKEQGIYVAKTKKEKRHKILKDNSDTPEEAKAMGKKAAKALNKQSTTPKWMDDEIISFLDPYVVNLNINIDKIIFKKNTADKVSVQVQNNVSPGQANLSITADKLFSAKVKSISKLKKVKKLYHLKTDTYIDTVNLNQLGSAIPALNGIQKGLLMVNMYGESEGMTTNQLIRVLNGKLKIGVNDLQQKLANPSGSVGKFLLLLAGGDWRSGISLKCAIADFDITKGDYEINTLMIDTTGAIIQGSGDIDLPAQKINIVLSPEAKYINLTSLSTAFRVIGNFDNIYFFPDAYSTAKTAASVVGATALAATGVGLIAIGAAVAGQGVYYANKNFCAESLKPLSEKEIKDIQKHNEGIMQNLLDDSNNIIGDTYSSTVEAGSSIFKKSVSGGSDLIGSAYSGTVDAGSSLLESSLSLFGNDSSSDSGATEIKNEK